MTQHELRLSLSLAWGFVMFLLFGLLVARWFLLLAMGEAAAGSVLYWRMHRKMIRREGNSDGQ